MRRLAICIPLLAIALAGCDQLGIELPAAAAAKREAEGKAIGAGCRHAARSVEVCYEMNRRTDKAAIFAGWREMNDYMRENNLQAMPAPVEVAASAPGESAAGDADDSHEEGKAAPSKAEPPKVAPGKAAKVASKH